MAKCECGNCKFSVGVDIESIDRFEKMIEKIGKARLRTIYTPVEIKYCFSKRKPAQHLAVRFAAKEAVIKALGGLGLGISYRKIEIRNLKSGLPKVNLLDKKLAKKLEISVSLSHCKDKAVAFVLVLVGISR